jgi:hypothetical protein
VKSRRRTANALAVTIRPPFGERAKPSTARLISLESRTLTGFVYAPMQSWVGKSRKSLWQNFSVRATIHRFVRTAVGTFAT